MTTLTSTLVCMLTVAQALSVALAESVTSLSFATAVQLMFVVFKDEQELT